MQKTAGFIASLGIGFLMTAAGLVLDAKWLTVTGLVLLSIAALLWGIGRFKKPSPLVTREEVAPTERASVGPPRKPGAPPGGTAIYLGGDDNWVIGGNISDCDNGIVAIGDRNTVDGVEIKDIGRRLPKRGDD